jgi:flagellar biosynthetic protein FliR
MFQLNTSQLLSGQIIVILLMFIRIFSIFFLAPLFSHKSIPATLRAAIAIVILILIYPVVPHPDGISADIDLFALVFLILKEASLGLIIGFAGMVVLSTMRFSGSILGRIMGLKEGNLIDPLFNESIGPLAQYQFILFMLLFLGVDGHHFIIKLMVKSFNVIPLGSIVISGQLVSKFVQMIGQMFVLSVQYASPIIAFLILTSVAFGIVGRAVPEMNLLIMLLPIKIFVGLMGMVVIFPLLVYFINGLIRTLYVDLNMILQMI